MWRTTRWGWWRPRGGSRERREPWRPPGGQAARGCNPGGVRPADRHRAGPGGGAAAARRWGRSTGDRRGGGRACRFGPADRGVGGVPDAGDRAAGPRRGRDGWPAGRRRPGRAHAPAWRRRDRGAAAQLQHRGRLAPGQPRRAWTAGRRAGRVAAGGHAAHVLRYEHDATVTLVAGWSRDGQALPVGTRSPIEEETLSAQMLRTGQPARTDSHADHPGAIGTRIRQLGIRSSVACPITVQGRLWGATAVSSTQPQPLPPGTQARIADFTELAATAIANTQARAALAASRARIVKAADQTRRRIERDLHDGIQQRLVSLALDLRATQASLPAQLGELHAQLDRVADGLSQALEELRETSRGIHPAALSQGGLGPALKVLARRCPLPVQADLKLQTRLPEPVEVAAYYVVAEALTNAAKHAHASLAHLAVQAHRDRLHLSVADDGVGGADPTRGSGLVGLSDRVQALGGTITVHSPTGQGTTLQIDLPTGLDGD